MTPQELTFIKLGGSLLTDKRQAGSFSAEVAARLAAELEEAARSRPGGLVVGHGSGSFGHATADEHRIHPGEIREEQLPGVVATQQGGFWISNLQRFTTHEELAKFQGVTISDLNIPGEVSVAKFRHMLGNAVSVNVAMLLFEQVFKCLGVR